MGKLRGFLDFDRLHFKSRATSFWLPVLKMALPELNHLTLDDILSCLVHRAIANMEVAQKMVMRIARMITLAMITWSSLVRLSLHVGLAT